MKKLSLLSVALGLGALAACQESPREEQAENIEANADNAAEAFEEAADNATNEVVEETLENQAEGLREGGENIADEVRNSDSPAGNTAQ
jgi:hypothetical protein